MAQSDSTLETRKPAQTEREWWAILKSDDKSFIRSMEDWQAALGSKDHPLPGCDQKTIDEFTRSLKFDRGGLAHAHYGGVARKLTYHQFKTLWGRFGLGMGLFEDHADKKCASQGTCSHSTSDICTSNC